MQLFGISVSSTWDPISMMYSSLRVADCSSVTVQSRFILSFANKTFLMITIGVSGY